MGNAFQLFIAFQSSPEERLATTPIDRLANGRSQLDFKLHPHWVNWGENPDRPAFVQEPLATHPNPGAWLSAARHHNPKRPRPGYSRNAPGSVGGESAASRL